MVDYAADYRELIDSLKFNENGLIPAVAQDHKSGAVLMVAWMNAEAVARTLQSGRVWYWSRSRRKLWLKGEESGNKQVLLEMRRDCDDDTLLLRVEQTGAACHTGNPTCFYRTVPPR